MPRPQTPAERMAQYAAQMEAEPPAPKVTATDPFFTYDRPAQYGVNVQPVKVPLRDGSYLAGELVRPANPDGSPAEGVFPGIVLEFNGYGAANFFALGARPYVMRGYVVVVVSVRGSGESPGDIDPFSPQEQQDNVELIEWLAAQPFCTGKIGQMGNSYGGHNSLLAAVNQPENLVAVIASQSFSDWYENTIFRGGIPNAEIRDWQQSTAPSTLTTYPEHPFYDEFWIARSVKARWDQLTVPVLDVGGWLDPYRGGMVENYLAHPEHVWMVAGPWSHAMPPGHFEDIASASYLAWWDYWLSDFPGALPESPVTSYEMPQGGWNYYSSWPPAESTPVHWVLAADGSLLKRADGADDGQPNGALELEFDAQGGSLSFTSAPLRGDALVIGNPDVQLRISLTGPDADIAVILEDVDESGQPQRITNGWLRVSHRDGNESPAPVVPGIVYLLKVPMWPADHRLAAHHRLRVTLSSEDYPLIDRVAPRGVVRVKFDDAAPVLTYHSIA